MLVPPQRQKAQWQRTEKAFTTEAGHSPVKERAQRKAKN
jgi:hypothetical protein